ncbi:MAG: ABC transporter permease [Chthonomonadales bacterium]|nr:ABC transporter permease [Chthonomonadales bacterium]
MRPPDGFVVREYGERGVIWLRETLQAGPRRLGATAVVRHQTWVSAAVAAGNGGLMVASGGTAVRPTLWGRLGGVVAPLAFLLVLVVVLGLAARGEGFLSRANWRTIVQSTAVVAILAIGETVVIIAGHIDLSVGRVLALSGVTAAAGMVFHGTGTAGGLALACASGAACGLANGLLTTFGRMPSFIATLGMMGVANGLALLVAGDANISGVAPGFEALSMGELLGTPAREGLPYPLLLMAFAAVAVHLLLARTAWGRHVYAIGGNMDAARLSGVALRRVTISVFVLSGLLSGFAAVLHVARTGGAQPTAGAGLELQAIAATVIGGTSLSGGSGGVVGTLIGAFLMAIIQNGCDLKGVHPHFQLIIIGSVIWLAALYDGVRRRQGR